MMREIRRGADQQILQREQTQGDEIHQLQVSKLIYPQPKQFRRLSYDDRNSKGNAMPYDKCNNHKGAQDISNDGEKVGEAIGQAHHKCGDRRHQYIVNKVFLVVIDPGLTWRIASI